MRSTSDNEHVSPLRIAQPHARLNGGLRGAGDQSLLDERTISTQRGPAGGLAVSANDMARWRMISR